MKNVAHKKVDDVRRVSEARAEILIASGDWHYTSNSRWRRFCKQGESYRTATIAPGMLRRVRGWWQPKVRVPRFEVPGTSALEDAKRFDIFRRKKTKS